MPIHETISTAPPPVDGPIGYDRLPDGTTVAGKVSVTPERTIADHVAAMNSAPPAPSDYTLPEIQVDGQPWQPNAQEAATLDNIKGMAHAAGLPAFEFANLAEIISRPSYVAVSPEVAEATLRHEWGNRFEERATAVAAVLDEVESKHPGSMRFLETSGLGNDLTLIQALYRAASRRR